MKHVNEMLLNFTGCSNSNVLQIYKNTSPYTCFIRLFVFINIICTTLSFFPGTIMLFKVFYFVYIPLKHKSNNEEDRKCKGQSSNDSIKKCKYKIRKNFPKEKDPEQVMYSPPSENNQWLDFLSQSFPNPLEERRASARRAEASCSLFICGMWPCCSFLWRSAPEHCDSVGRSGWSLWCRMFSNRDNCASLVYGIHCMCT